MPNVVTMFETGIAPALRHRALTGGAAGNLACAGVSLQDRIALVLAFNRTVGVRDKVLSQVGLSRGSTDRNVASLLFYYQIGATTSGLNTYKQKAAVAAGTALAAGTIPINTWGLYLFSIDASGTITATPAAANFTTGYATEPLAIAALPATPTNQAAMGYVTVQTKVGTTFVGGTDALAGGASGNVANATNYYDAGDNYSTVATGNSPLDLTSQFTINANNQINNTAGTDTTGMQVIVLWWLNEVHERYSVEP